MKTFNPEIGARVTITTRYKNDYILSDEKWKDTTYKDVTVLEPEKWMKSNQVKISSNTEKMPFWRREAGKRRMSAGSVFGVFWLTGIRGARGNKKAIL